ncbi:MAG: hypothetical protein ACREMB_12680 [Candidatus Rokuibacteriota bacterium]
MPLRGKTTAPGNGEFPDAMAGIVRRGRTRAGRRSVLTGSDACRSDALQHFAWACEPLADGVLLVPAEPDAPPLADGVLLVPAEPDVLPPADGDVLLEPDMLPPDVPGAAVCALLPGVTVDAGGQSWLVPLVAPELLGLELPDIELPELELPVL